MKTNFKLENLKVAFKESIRRRSKMFTIRDSILRSLDVPLRQILYLSYGRIRSLASRSRVALEFLTLILRLKKNHGADFTIKWLKACYVALQKSLGRDNLKSLRDLEPNLPLPRLINGIPAVIKSRDRHQIRQGNEKVIIFWSSLFSVYRVLKCTYKLKTSTITDPFKGDNLWMNLLLDRPQFKVYFDSLPGFKKLVENSNLAPRKFLLLRSASPSSNVSWHGLFTDCHYIMHDKEMFKNVRDYIDSVKSLGWNTQWFWEKLLEMTELGLQLGDYGGLKAKCSMTSAFAQFAVKEEAAGKLRVFAMVDSISQTILAPLHNFMFSLLKLIPNDGTFDQESSIRRSQVKACQAGKAYSFDLSAATDRLPVDLSVKILSKIFSDEFGKAWKSMMVDRDFYFSARTSETYGLEHPVPFRYSVGQPMGALSSWPALALTHHWILQYCSALLGRTVWEDQYEILGDDLVIFDSLLAEKYLEVAKNLGVEINLSKSISSPEIPVFEFAKRTCLGMKNVSPVPFKQLLSKDTLSERVTNVTSLLERGLIKSGSILGAALSTYGSWKFLISKKFSTPLLAILGVLYQKGIIPHRWLVESLVDPDDPDLEQEDLKIPRQAIVKLIEKVNAMQSDSSITLSYPFSKEEDRKEVYDDYEPEFANVIANTAYTKAKVLERDHEDLVRKESENLWAANWVGGKTEDGTLVKVDPSVEKVLKSAITGWFDDLLFSDGKFDPFELVSSIEENKDFYYRRLDLEGAQKIQDQVDHFIFNYDLTPKELNQVKIEAAPVIRFITKTISGKSSRYLKITRPKDT